MSSRQNAYLITLAFQWFSRLTFNAKMVVVFTAIAGYATWAYVHNHSQGPGIPGATASAGACADKAPYGAPRQTQAPATELGELRAVCRDGYLLGYSGKTRTSLWVAEHLTPASVSGKEPRTNLFLEDTTIPAEDRSLLSDYRHSGYDRGHMAPAGDFASSAKQMGESFYLSNMVPQNPENNQGPWAQLESHVRGLARTSSDMYVVTGPLFVPGLPTTIGASHVAVPARIYKIVLDAKTSRMGAWLLPNSSVPKNKWNDYCTSVALVEKESGLTFFPDMPADAKSAMALAACAL